MPGDTRKWHFEHCHPVQTQIRTRSDITIYKTHPVQVTFRNKLRKSRNHNVLEIYKSTRNINIQYDQFNSTLEALKHIHSSAVSCKMEKLTTQSLVVKSMCEFVDGRFINQWSNVIRHLPRNIFSFTIRYLNNTLANGTNVIKWGITNSSTCIFCDQQQTLGHVIGGCETALLESSYNWRDSILLNIYIKLLNHKDCKLL